MGGTAYDPRARPRPTPGLGPLGLAEPLLLAGPVLMLLLLLLEGPLALEGPLGLAGPPGLAGLAGLAGPLTLVLMGGGLPIAREKTKVS